MIQIGGFKTLTEGNRFYAYSGLKNAGVSAPPDITLINIESTGLRDAFVKIEPFSGQPTSIGLSDLLGISVLIDDVEIYKSQPFQTEIAQDAFELFIPRQSKLTIKSINTAANTIQERGANILGWYL